MDIFFILIILALVLSIFLIYYSFDNKKQEKVLSINNIPLSEDELKKHALALATDHTVTYKSDIKTYPKNRLIENFNFITNVYNLLNEHVKLGIIVHPAGEWLLDNYYLIEEAVYQIKKELNEKPYKKLPGLKSGSFSGFARIYELAVEIVSYTDAKVNEDNIVNFLREYQTKKNLNMEEIWCMPIFLEIAIIENIRNICEKIYSNQIQKYKVENIIERLVENKDAKDIKFKNVKFKFNIKDDMEIKSAFVEHMTYKLKKMGRKAVPYIDVLEEQIEKLRSYKL